MNVKEMQYILYKTSEIPDFNEMLNTLNNLSDSCKFKVNGAVFDIDSNGILYKLNYSISKYRNIRFRRTVE